MKHLPTITIESIQHKDQRYDTAGDYFEIDEDCTDFCISQLSDWKMEALVAVHELVEYILVKHKGIKITDIDRFDINFEKKRKKGNTDEPGDDRNAPYYKQHQFATKIEKMLCKELKVDWNKYEKEFHKLKY